jgi:hypothetical protein
MADHALVLGGLALVALGATGLPMGLPLGWTALGLAFFAWVAEASYVDRRSLERALDGTAP